MFNFQNFKYLFKYYKGIKHAIKIIKNTELLY